MHVIMLYINGRNQPYSEDYITFPIMSVRVTPDVKSMILNSPEWSNVAWASAGYAQSQQQFDQMRQGIFTKCKQP